MGTDNLYWERKKVLERKKAIRCERENILIVCEGKKTEKNYFEDFRVASADVVGNGMSTKSLVKFAKELSEKASARGDTYDQVWCVFDRDSFPKGQFNTAIQMAKAYGFRIAYSNEAFELWYILHFEYLNAGISRKNYPKKLDGYLKRKYEKNCKDMYEELAPYQKSAIKRARKLCKAHGSCSPVNANPSTTVHLLVLELNKYQV